MPAALLDRERVEREWPALEDGSLYLNAGSCGRKPTCVLEAISAGWKKLNFNPTKTTFFDQEIWNDARQSFADLLAVSSDNLVLTQNTTQALQMVVQSFLLLPGDELVTTTQEHGSLKTVARYLEETRGIVVRRYAVEPLNGSEVLCNGLLNLLGEKTKLVAVSEIGSYSGWRANLMPLESKLAAAGVPLLADGAHAPGQGPCLTKNYRLWVGSGHKWLGAPNGTGALFVKPELSDQLRPCWLGDRYYNQFDNPLRRFEFPGTCDVVRWLGLTAACRLALELGPQAVADYQMELAAYTRRMLEQLPGTVIRTPDKPGEYCGMIVATWDARHVKVPHLQDWLWNEHRIWVHPDYCYGNEAHGMRISCHVSVTKADIDKLGSALAKAIR